MLRFVQLIFLIVLLGVAGAAPEAADLNAERGVALKGYDAVAYFGEGKAIKGSPNHTVDWSGVTWRFASNEHRNLFEQDPARYAPRFGGYCAFGVAQDKKIDADPTAWSVIGGKLYVYFNKSVRTTWLKDPVGYIEKAERNWPSLAGR
jgi:YHS domain-containing protein